MEVGSECAVGLFCLAAPTEMPLNTTDSCRSRHQSRDPEQVIGGANEIGVHLHSVASPVAGFAKSTDCLHPAEALLDSFTYPLTDRVALMTRGTRIERRASRPCEILCDMRGDLEFPTRGDELAGVITFVAAQGDSTAAGQAFVGHRDRRTPLGSAVGRLDLKIDQQAVAVLRQGVGRIVKLGLLALTLARQQCLRVSGRLMSLVGPTLTVEVDRRVARIIGAVAGF